MDCSGRGARPGVKHPRSAAMAVYYAEKAYAKEGDPVLHWGLEPDPSPGFAWARSRTPECEL
eukprot:4175707-Alexandrium_andersonii.AAC.1